jgi:hypothetical protein
VATILEKAIKKMTDQGILEFPLFDSNGNNVGDIHEEVE